MTARDDVIEQANYFRDAAKDCVVEVGPDVYVVTVTVAQAELLRAHLTTLVAEPAPLATGGLVGPADPPAPPTDYVLTDGLIEATQSVEHVTVDVGEVVPPVKRGPGRPRKQQG